MKKRRGIVRRIQTLSRNGWFILAFISSFSASLLLGGILYILIYAIETGDVPYVLRVGYNVISVIPRTSYYYMVIRQTMTETLGVTTLLTLSSIGVLLMYYAPVKGRDHRTVNLLFSLGMILFSLSVFMILFLYSGLKQWPLTY